MFAHLVHHYHNIIAGLVIHQQFPVTIVDYATGRIIYLLQKGIRVGTLTVVFAHHLKSEKAEDVDDNDNQCCSRYDVFTVREVGHGYMASMKRIKRSVTRRLPPIVIARYCQSARLKASSMKKMVQYVRMRQKA